MDWPFHGIVVGDAYSQLHEGLAGTMESQLRKLKNIIEREVLKVVTSLTAKISASDVAKRLFEKIEQERSSSPIEVFLGKCSCGFVDSYYNMAMDVDDFDHFPVTPVQDQDGW